jgi:hypothetical protein
MPCFPEQVGKQPYLRIRCRACGRTVTWSNRKAVRLLGYGTGPAHASDMLKCSKCDVAGKVEFL